jgi:hypothetical protein
VTGVDRQPDIDRAVREWRSAFTSRIATGVQEAVAEGLPAGLDADTAADVLFMVAIDRPTDTDAGDSPAAVTVAAARRIIATFLGTERIGSLTATAREELVAAGAVVLDGERHRLARLLLTGTGVAARGTALRQAAAAVEAAR